MDHLVFEVSGRQAAVYSLWNGKFVAEAEAAAVAGDGYWDPMEIPVSFKETSKQMDSLAAPLQPHDHYPEMFP